VSRLTPRAQLGQASVEYTLVLILVVLVLIAEQGGEPGPIGLVVQALRDLFHAYSWAISFSSNLTPL
jgi:Flp pilus assembly pilin Flp